MRAQFFVIFLSSIIFHYAEALVPSPATCATLPNEEFAIDLRRCQNTCEFYGRTWDCSINYKPQGDCYCKPGFARIKEGGKCVSVKNNAKCKAKLPIQPESCNGPNEMYTESLGLNVCDTNCRTYGCLMEEQLATFYRWSPHCICGENDVRYTDHKRTFKRLSSGQCVHISDPQCVAEFQPSPERCAALGQIYTVNAPCQPSCYGEQYCPPPGGTCICPPNKLAMPHTAGPYVGVEITPYLSYPATVITCHSQATCPETQVKQVEPIRGPER